MSSSKKELRQLVQRLRREGLVVEHHPGPGRHATLVLCNGQHYPLARSPSDWRMLRNMECDIRRLTRA